MLTDHPAAGRADLAKEHARKVAQNLAADSGLVFIPGESTVHYEDSDMGPAFHQRR